MQATPALAAPVLEVSPTSGAVGTVVTLTGINFESYKGDEIYIFFDNEEIDVSPITVPEEGSFSFEFNIPDGAELGRNEIRVESELGEVAVSVFTVREAEINLDPQAGVVGTELTIEGEGFYADKVVTLYYDDRLLGTETATATGEFSYHLTLPASTAGEHEIRARNAEGDSAEAEFEVVPSIFIDPTSGAAGSVLFVSGHGFSSRVNVGIYFTFDEVAIARTDELGNFEIAFFQVPQMTPGPYDVNVEDAEGKMATAEFAVIAGASLDKIEANVGTELTVTGTGFAAGGMVTIAYDEVPVAQIQADRQGSFQAVLRVPASRHGSHFITVDDGENSQQLVFNMESEAPSAPVLVQPVGTGQARAETQFDWADVEDPSLPVTYRFQVASDRDFTAMVLAKDLADSEYTLSREERLAAVKKEAPYYWRVQAVDGAANESPWSDVESFYVAAPPVPVMLLPEMDGEAETATYFDWEDATNLSPPMTYHLQVASDRSFASLVLEQVDLASSEYALTEKEKLEGEWSSPKAFHVGFTFPGWALYTLIGLGVIVLVFLAFLVGRRIAYHQS
jgi:hypothetical protein